MKYFNVVDLGILRSSMDIAAVYCYVNRMVTRSFVGGYFQMMCFLKDYQYLWHRTFSTENTG